MVNRPFSRSLLCFLVLVPTFWGEIRFFPTSRDSYAVERRNNFFFDMNKFESAKSTLRQFSFFAIPR